MRIARTFIAAATLVGLQLVGVGAAEAVHCPYPPNTSSLSINAFPRVVTAGQTTFFKGYLTENRCAIPGETVNVYARYTAGGSSSFRGSQTTNGSGVWSRTLAFPQNYAVRALFVGDGDHPARLSAELTVLVRTRVSTSFTAISGCRLNWSGTTFPAAPAGTLVILQRLTASGPQNLASTRSGAGGGYNSTSRLPCGSHTVRTIVGRTATNIDGISPSRGLTLS